MCRILNPRLRKQNGFFASAVFIYLQYHTDPLDPKGILAFWDFGADAIDIFATEGLEISIISGPKGKDKRIVWKAKKCN